jgi:hypothetical protein
METQSASNLKLKFKSLLRTISVEEQTTNKIKKTNIPIFLLKAFNNEIPFDLT